MWRRDYYPFGEDRTASGVGNDYKFTGNREETETDMYHFGYRDLMSSLGRWNAVDPSWLLRPNLSPYTYVGNNPLRWVDILGLDWCYGCGPDGSDIYEFEIPVEVVGTYTGDDWGFTMELWSRDVGDWFSETFPLASENNSWFYQAWRGTGDIVEDINNASMLMLGMGLGGVGVTAMSPAAAALYTQYSAVISAMGWTAAQYSVWVSTVGADKAGRFLNTVASRGKFIGEMGYGYYVQYNQPVNSFFQGVSSGLNWSTKTPMNNWERSGYMIGSAMSYFK